MVVTEHMFLRIDAIKPVYSVTGNTPNCALSGNQATNYPAISETLAIMATMM